MAFSNLSLRFQVADDHVSVGDVAELSFERTDAFSIVVWFRSTMTGTGALFSKQLNGGTFPGYTFFLVGGSGGLLQARVGFGSVSNESACIETDIGGFNDGFWHQAVMTYDGSSTAAGITIYVDGLEVASSVVDDDLASSILTSAPVEIGRRTSSGSTFIGNMSDVAVYDIELSAGQVDTIYNEKVPVDLTAVGPTANLVGYWRLGDGDTFPTATDSSASANDGTMTNITADDIVADPVSGSDSVFSIEFNNGSSNERINIGNVPELSFERTDAFSVVFWFRTAVTGFQTIISKATAAFRGWEVGFDSSGHVRLYLVNTNGSNQIVVNSLLVVSDDEWHQAVVTYDGSSSGAGVNIYIDGIDFGTNISSDSLSATILNSESVTIGIRSTVFSTHYVGFIDSLAVYGKELSLVEAVELNGDPSVIDLTAIGPTEDMLAYWRMGDGDTFPTVDDSSHNRLTGSMINMEVGDLSSEVFSLALIASIPSVAGVVGLIDSAPAFVVGVNFGESDFVFEGFYKMRARNLPNTSYVSWVAPEPDFDGLAAGTPILPGSAVVTATWGQDNYIPVSVPALSGIQSLTAPATVSDPSGGVLVVLVDTSDVGWSASDEVTLPAVPTTGSSIGVKDIGDTASTKPIVVDGNGKTIDGSATYTIAANMGSVSLVYSGTEWQVI